MEFRWFHMFAFLRFPYRSVHSKSLIVDVLTWSLGHVYSVFSPATTKNLLQFSSEFAGLKSVDDWVDCGIQYNEGVNNIVPSGVDVEIRKIAVKKIRNKFRKPTNDVNDTYQKHGFCDLFPRQPHGLQSGRVCGFFKPQAMDYSAV